MHSGNVSFFTWCQEIRKSVDISKNCLSLLNPIGIPTKIGWKKLYPWSEKLKFHGYMTSTHDKAAVTEIQNQAFENDDNENFITKHRLHSRTSCARFLFACIYINFRTNDISIEQLSWFAALEYLTLDWMELPSLLCVCIDGA